MKLICIGRNYSDHAKELSSEPSEQPVVFLKPDTALLPPGQPFMKPAYSREVHYEIEVVLRMGRAARSIGTEKALDYVDGISVGLDFTARDVQKTLKEKGLPWEKAKAFDGSAVIGKLLPVLEFKEQGLLDSGISFELRRNGQTVQSGNSRDMLFSFPEILAEASQILTLQRGDLVFTGTPAGVGPVETGDILEGYLEGRELFKLGVG